MTYLQVMVGQAVWIERYTSKGFTAVSAVVENISNQRLYIKEDGGLSGTLPFNRSGRDMRMGHHGQLILTEERLEQRKRQWSQHQTTLRWVETHLSNCSDERLESVANMMYPEKKYRLPRVVSRELPTRDKQTVWVEHRWSEQESEVYDGFVDRYFSPYIIVKLCDTLQEITFTSEGIGAKGMSMYYLHTSEETLHGQKRYERERKKLEKRIRDALYEVPYGKLQLMTKEMQREGVVAG